MLTHFEKKKSEQKNELELEYGKSTCTYLIPV